MKLINVHDFYFCSEYNPSPIHFTDLSPGDIFELSVVPDEDRGPLIKVWSIEAELYGAVSLLTGFFQERDPNDCVVKLVGEITIDTLNPTDSFYSSYND
jgi:hypothetical protein